MNKLFVSYEDWLLQVQENATSKFNLTSEEVQNHIESWDKIHVVGLRKYYNTGKEPLELAEYLMKTNHLFGVIG